MIILNKDGFIIRTLAESDALLLLKWLSDPRVLEYFAGRDRPYDLALVREHFFNEEDDATCCIIQYDGVDIGYIQFYRISEQDYEEYGYSREELIYGMDQFIGEVDYWNKGIGTKLVKAIAEYLVQEVGVDKIIMDPRTWNTRALSVYEKCGFRKVKLIPEHEWHEGQMRDCWLIEYDGVSGS
ncbi:GNAT family N-acetyltransferase [Paenibacillus terrigena]|uniref:GNAT family N-acetyltransferase n=1 Tax=Paenibacillus terrigena TaxID=369333 RepID=UPI0028D07D7F|nr:GNAT family N-acetyltransferase [Paenibacillus terrigena]